MWHMLRWFYCRHLDRLVPVCHSMWVLFVRYVSPKLKPIKEFCVINNSELEL